MLLCGEVDGQDKTDEEEASHGDKDDNQGSGHCLLLELNPCADRAV